MTSGCQKVEGMDKCSCFPQGMGKLFSKSPSRSPKKGRSEKYVTEAEDIQDPYQTKVFPPIHTDGVTSVHPVSTNICLSGSQDKSVALYNFKEGTVLCKWTGHEKEVTKVLYAAKANAYLSASRDKYVNMWQSGISDPVLSFVGHEMVVTGLTINAENSQLCTGSRDNFMKLWSVETGQCVLQNSISRNLITHVKWAAGTDVIAQTGEDKEVRLWDGRTLEVTKTFPKKQYIQTCCDISEDHNYILSCSNGFGGQGCEATLWDVRNSSIVHEFKGHYESVGACAFIPSSVSGNRNLVVTSSNDCSVRLWDRDTKECIACYDIPGSGPLSSLGPYTDGSLAVSSFNAGIHILQLKTKADEGYCILPKAQF